MSAEERPASDWGDGAECDRWADALAAIAERERLERGVDEPTRLTVGYGALWGYYGPIRIRLAGADADLEDEASLFEEIDFWVAFERPGGPGKRLERDQAVIDEWLGRLPSVQALWIDAAERVFRDVAATTRIRWNWRIAVHEDELVFPEAPDGVVGFWASEVPAGWTPDRRQLALPQLWLEADDWATSLPEPEGLVDAIAHVADQVQEAVMEELCTTWPSCPGHGHPLEIEARGDVVHWACPQGSGFAVEIGALSAAAGVADQ